MDLNEKPKPLLASEAKSEELQDIVSSVPSSLVRNGSIFILLIFLSLFAGAHLISYPDVLPGEIEITTRTPPVIVVSNSAGEVKKLQTEDQKNVLKNEILMVIDNAARFDDILSLKTALQTNDFASVDSLFRLSLGEVAP